MHFEQIERAGIFEFFVDYSSGAHDERKQSTRAYFSVDPLLEAAAKSSISVKDGQISGGEVLERRCSLDLDGIVLQTVIAKWMGTFDHWKPHLDIMRDRGYNMIHYTPLQQRGSSNSPYSIFDQLQFADGLFEPGTSEERKPGIVKEWLNRIRDDWGMLGMIDIVLNHTAHNSAFLLEHPDAGEMISYIRCAQT